MKRAPSFSRPAFGQRMAAGVFITRIRLTRKASS